MWRYQHDSGRVQNSVARKLTIAQAQSLLWRPYHAISEVSDAADISDPRVRADLCVFGRVRVPHSNFTNNYSRAYSISLTGTGSHFIATSSVNA